MTTHLFTDTYSDSRPAGRVIGFPGPGGLQRGGVDAEGLIAIDNGALRIQPLLEPGWGRAAIAYGPFKRENGLTFVAVLLNGHNTSQNGHLTQSFPRRLYRWARGDGSTRLPARLFRWRYYPVRGRTFRQFRRWFRTQHLHARGRLTPLDDNLAVGWFPASAHPSSGSAFIMHALGAENGELRCRVDSALLPALRGVQNIPLVLAVILRKEGAVYYAASVPETGDLPAPPELRPLAIDPFSIDEEVYASIHQSVLGQIGFHVDSRIYGTRVSRHAGFDEWFGTAHAADSLRGDGPLTGIPAQVGGQWLTSGASWQRTRKGSLPGDREALAYLDPGKPSGLIHAVTCGSGSREVCLVWRLLDPANFWVLSVGDGGSRLRLKENGEWTDIAGDQAARLREGPAQSVQIVDDGRTFSASLDGARIFGSSFTDRRFDAGSGVGIYAPCGPGSPVLSQFEAHPRTIILPGIDALAPACPRPGDRIVVHDDFDGSRAELSHARGVHPRRVWRREFGRGVIARTGAAKAQVKASVKEPNPGRTFYTVAWEHPKFADLEVEMTAPGEMRGQGERGRGGFVFWQDNRNYIIVSTWLDDCYDGASISSFFHLNGFEELYDAVWTNVGRRIQWGVPYRLRVWFDGLLYIAHVNGEPVLYRALTDVYPNAARLRINRVGLAANWEWGDDTGTIFRDFTARCG